VNAVLVGEALMRSPEIESACRALAGGRPLVGEQPSIAHGGTIDGSVPAV